MSMLDKLNERSDATKWGHPEFEDLFAASEGAPRRTFSETYNPEIPFEERKAKTAANMAMMEKYFYPVDPEKSKRYDVPGCPEEPETTASVLFTKPEETTKKKLPCIFYVPTGGLCGCNDKMFNNVCMANHFGTAVVTCTYRHVFSGGGYPQTINDLHAAYKWVVDHEKELGVNSDKILVYGQSSGGHLALALCHRLKRYGYRPRGCVVESPIPDERMMYPSSRRICSWGGREVHASSEAWLGYQHADPAAVSPEAFANHAESEDCVGLPPTFIHTFDCEVSSDSCMAYASKLIQAGVFTDMHVWGGAGHSTFGAQAILPEEQRTPMVQFLVMTIKKQIDDCFKYDLRRSWIAGELKKED